MTAYERGTVTEAEWAMEAEAHEKGARTMTHVPLDSITLRAGAHEDRKDGVCLMEAAAWYAGEPHSDKPACVCPVLAAYGRALNDCMPDDERVRLLQYVPRVVGTAGDGHAEARGLMAIDWMVRTYTPTWLDLAGLTDEAAELRALPAIRSDADVQGSLDALGRARKRAASARDAAGAAWAAGDDARAAWAAGDAGAAARDAAAAAGAARYAARDARDARDAAWDAAWAAWAAWDAAWAARAAGDAAGDAAGAALKPTADSLRASAVDLYARMIALGAEDRSTYTTPVDEIMMEATHE